MEPGRELDRLVAEVIGIPIYPYDEIKHNHAWLDDPANYPYLTSGEGRYLILRWAPDQNGDLWAPSSDNDLAMWAWGWLEKNNPWRPMETDPGDISLSRYWLNAKPAVVVVMVDGAEIVDYRPGLPPSTRYNFAIWGQSYPPRNLFSRSGI